MILWSTDEKPASEVIYISTMRMSVIILWFSLFPVPAWTGDAGLPSPRQEGGMPLLTALKQRQSMRSFSDKPLSMQTISDLLWAGFGFNREELGMRTAPSSLNVQDITIYVFTPDGVWTYDAPANRLLGVKEGDHRNLAGIQEFVWTAPLSLVYVSDFSLMKHGDREFTDEMKLTAASISAGHISQNVYLFCASEGLGAVARASLNREAFVKEFGLSANQRIIFGQTIGYPIVE